MRDLFRTRPTTEFENYTAKHIGAGRGYHQRFTVNPGRAMMWELEKIALRDIVSGLRPRKVLDFACGTGRIASFIESTFPEPSVHGIDISESMLAIARGQSVRAQYELMDAQQALVVLWRKVLRLDPGVSFLRQCGAVPSTIRWHEPEPAAFR